MIYRSVNWMHLLRLIILLGLGIVVGVGVALMNYLLAFTASLLILILLLEFMYNLNAINRKLTFFFEAVINEDSTLNFPASSGTRTTRELHQSLNRLNDIISDIKIRNERNERFFRELLKYSATGIIVADKEGFVDLVNDAALRLTGLKALATLKLLKQKQPDLYDLMQEIHPAQTRSLKILVGNELKQVSVRVAKLKFGEKEFAVFSLYDIRTEMEENELDSWQKLIRVLTHEIMNSIAPITSLSNTLGRILNNENETNSAQVSIEKAREGLQVIEETAKGLMHFVENYRKLTKIPKPLFKPIKINDWAKRLEILVKDRIENAKVKFTISIDTKRLEFIGDEKLLTQVLINLIYNSIDAIGEQNSPQIILRFIDSTSGKMQIEVTDNGMGIAPEMMEKIFVPFFTTKESGSGIGLSLSRQIMRLHRGSLSVHTQARKTTTFVVEL